MQRLLLHHSLLQKVVEITSAIKGRIQAVAKESQRVNYAVIEIRMTRTANEDPYIYTLGDGQDKMMKKKLRLPFH